MLSTTAPARDADGVPVTRVVERPELLNNYLCSVCTLDDGAVQEFKYDKLAADLFMDHVTLNSTNIL